MLYTIAANAAKTTIAATVTKRTDHMYFFMTRTFVVCLKFLMRPLKKQDRKENTCFYGFCKEKQESVEK